MSFLLVAQRALTVPGWVKNALWRAAKATPSLDLPFADSKSLVDAITGRQLISFARASSGTYTDSAGVLRTATTNLATFSQTLNNPAWVLTGTGATITATADIAAPDGTMTAWTLTCGAGGFAQIQQIHTGISGVSYTGSFWIRRRSGTSTIAIRVSENTNTTLAGVTSDWQRFSFTATSTTTTIRLGINLSGTSDAVDIWGAQLEQSSTVGEYVPTGSTINSAPRFDHNPLTGESLGLLVEEQRTNLLLRSEEFNDASWAKVNVTTTANTTTAPNGTITADSVTPNTATSLFYTQQNVTTTASTTYTWSVYVKANGFSWVFLDAFDGSNHRTWFDLTNGVTGTVEAGNTSTITSVGNGWYRCTLTRSSAGGSTSYAVAIVSGNNSLNGTGNSSNGIYLWGAQLEAGSGPPTSYIGPTTTAAATRNADVAQITGTNFSSWYRQDEGTWFGDAFREFAVPAGQFPVIVDARTTGAGPNVNQFSYLLESIAGIYIAAGGVVQSELYPLVPAGTRRRRVASAYAANNFAASVNGSTPLLDSTGSVGTIPSMTIGSVTGSGQYLNGHIRRLTYWPQALPGQLAAITQP